MVEVQKEELKKQVKKVHKAYMPVGFRASLYTGWHRKPLHVSDYERDVYNS